MKSNTDTQTKLKYVTRNGQADTAFVLAIKRQQAARTVKRALAASFKASWYFVATLQDASEKTTKYTDEYKQHYGTSEVVEEVSVSREQVRNQYGQFVAG